MSHTPKFSRRSALAGAAVLPLAATVGVGARAAAPLLGEDRPRHMRVSLGQFDVTTLLAGDRVVDDPHTIFGLNVDADTFGTVSQQAGLPTDKAQFFFTPTLVNTGQELVLFDTGLVGSNTAAVIEAAGHTADQVDVVVLTHMHGDHIGGMANDDGQPTFRNARYVTGRVEFDAWAKMDNQGFQTKVQPFADQMTFVEGGGSPVSGVTAMEAFGHTPGHMAYVIESDGAQLLLGADFANHYVWSLAHPEWEVKFDMDKSGAAATRKRLLDMLAADRMPFVGYHMPFPGIGYVEKDGAGGYRYAAHTYQLTV